MFTEADAYFMKLALHEAGLALAAGDFPVGAVLLVDGALWGMGRNALYSEGRTVNHAEHVLLDQCSSRLRQYVLEMSQTDICLYSTLEPCLMCLGTAVMHRVTRIVVACPDPFGGAAGLDPAQLGSIYPRRWPKLDTGLFKEQSCDLILEFLSTEKPMAWEKMLADFQGMRASW